jgi:ATP-dependent Clp protease protease subunit
MMPRAWFKFTMAAEDTTVAELAIFGGIGASYWDDDAVSAAQFVKDLKALPANVKTIRVRVNSPGGSVFDGIAIANALRDQVRNGRAVETTVEGLAASAASVVIMAGSTIKVADNALVMVHHPYTIEVGNAAAMRKMADTLDQITESIIATYRWHSELSADAIRGLMDAETWMTADEAITYGFATEKVEGLQAAASIDPRAMAKFTVPEQFKARVDALLVQAEKPAPKPTAAAATEVLRVCREANCLELAESLIADGAPLADVQSRVSAERSKKDQTTARSNEITAACAIAKLPQLTAGYIAGGMPVADVQTHLTTIKALVDKADIDAGLNPDHGTTDHTASWKRAFGKR